MPTQTLLLILFKYSFYKGKYYTSKELALPLVNGVTCMPKQESLGLILECTQL